VSAAAYGTVLVLAALALLETDDVTSGVGWELVVGVGAATWLAHVYAEVVGDHVRTGTALSREEIAAAMADGAPILLATLPPAVVLVLGRAGLVPRGVALWAAVAIGVLQLVGLGVVVASILPPRDRRSWLVAGVTAAVGIAVVTMKVGLGH
jgi:hypothetical protein